MRKIIKGRVYDTAKAQLIGEVRNLSPTDFRFYDAALYKAPRSNRFFIFGNGGPMTPFGKQCSDGSWTFGEKLIPMSQESAHEWAEQNLSEEVVKIFFPTEEA